MKPKNPPEYVHSRRALARKLGCHENSISRWLKEHHTDPEIDSLRTNDGRYHVPSWEAFIKRHGINMAAEKVKAEQFLDTPEIKRQQEIEKLEKMREERRRAKSELIEKKTAAKILGESHERLKQILRQKLEDELPPILAGLNAGAIRAEMRKANDSVCVLMSEYVNQMEAV